MSKEIVDGGNEAMERWNGLLRDISKGVALEAAAPANNMTRNEINACVLSGPAEGARWFEARLAGKRARWPISDFEDIFERIAAKVPTSEAVQAVRGTDESAEFFELIDANTELNDGFKRAQRANARAMVEGLSTVAADTSRDTIPGPKGGEIPNMAAVSRSKLRVEHGQWVAAAHLPEVYGEQKPQTQVNVQINLAERLEEAQTRLRKFRERDRLEKEGASDKPRIGKAEIRNAVDVVFAAKPAPTRAELRAVSDRKAAEATTAEKWVDDEPAKPTMWLEEK
jgi:hypothetical protein